MSQENLSKRKEFSQRDLLPKSNNTFFTSWVLIGLLSLGFLAFTQLPKMATFLEEVDKARLRGMDAGDYFIINRSHPSGKLFRTHLFLTVTS